MERRGRGSDSALNASSSSGSPRTHSRARHAARGFQSVSHDLASQAHIDASADAVARCADKLDETRRHRAISAKRAKHGRLSTTCWHARLDRQHVGPPRPSQRGVRRHPNASGEIGAADRMKCDPAPVVRSGLMSRFPICVNAGNTRQARRRADSIRCSMDTKAPSSPSQTTGRVSITLPRQTVRRVSPAASRRRVRGHGYWPRDGPEDRPQTRWPHLGRGRGRSRRHLLLHAWLCEPLGGCTHLQSLQIFDQRATIVVRPDGFPDIMAAVSRPWPCDVEPVSISAEPANQFCFAKHAVSGDRIQGGHP